MSGAPVARRKTNYVRSEKLMKAYRSIPCQNCGLDDGTVCGAHSNAGEHGKGKSIKASDDKAASLCFVCHAAIDQGSRLSGVERVTIWEAAHIKTVRLLVRLRRWPASVPVPEYVQCQKTLQGA